MEELMLPVLMAVGFTVMMAHKFGYLSLGDSSIHHAMAAVVNEIGASKEDVSRVLRGRALDAEYNGAQVRVEFKSWTEHNNNNDTRSFSSMEVTSLISGIPPWFSFAFNDEAWSMDLGDFKVVSMDESLMLSVMSKQSRALLTKLMGAGRIDIKGGRMGCKIEAPFSDMHDLFAEEAIGFIRAVEDIARTVPKTKEELEYAVVEVAKDPRALSSMLKRIVARMESDERATRAIARAVDGQVHGNVLVRLYDAEPKVGALIREAQWDTARNLEVLHASMSLKDMDPERRQYLVNELFSRLPLDALSVPYAKAYPKAMYPLLKHHWASGVSPEEVVAKGDALIPFISGPDAVEWLLALSQSHPELCDYERVGAVLKHKMPPTQRARLLDVLARVFDAQPELVREPRWLKRTLGLLAFGSEEQAQRFAPLLESQLQVSHFGQLSQTAQDPMLQEHPIQLAVGPALRALEGRAAAGGALSLSDAPGQAGELTSVAEKGALSSSKE